METLTRWVSFPEDGTEERWHIQDGEAEMPVTRCGIDFHMRPVIADEFEEEPADACAACLEAARDQGE